MSTRFILAHDLGTTGDKASLFDGAGTCLASEFSAYGVEYPHPNWAEQNPEDWWQAVCMSTQTLMREGRIAPQDIACIVFSGQMMGAVAVDRQARPLRNAIIWADTRAIEESRQVIEKVGFEKGYQITGHRISSSYSCAKMMWVREHQPEIYKQAHKFLQAKDFIVARLTGHFVTDFSDASGTNLLDLETRDWSDEILAACGLNPALLPELHASTDVVGEITSRAADEIGLASGTPVIIGGGDGCCAATGAGVVAEGSAYNYLGSSSWIGIATRKPILDPTLRTFTFVHLVPGMYSPTGTMQAAGGSYQWLRDTFCLPERETAERLQISPYELMNLQVEKSPPGANNLIYLPYLLGERSPRWNPKASGAYIGLTIRHGRADIMRATMEGISLNLRVILEAFQKQGARIAEMRVIGGGARSGVWRQILADIFGLRVVRPRLLEDATSMGAAIAGGVGVGLFPDFEVATALTPVIDRNQPNAQLKEKYDRLYEIFNQCYEALEPLYDRLALEGEMSSASE